MSGNDKKNNEILKNNLKSFLSLVKAFIIGVVITYLVFRISKKEERFGVGRGKIYKNIGELVGNTPLLEINKIIDGSKAKIVVKLEAFNPGLSVKDRVGFAMVTDAEKRGTIKPNLTTIIEPTSGNTGIGLALAALVKGYKLILFDILIYLKIIFFRIMPEIMSVERRTTMASLSAEVVLTPGKNSMIYFYCFIFYFVGINGSISKAEELAETTPNSFIPNQFNNPANPQIHYKTTGPGSYLCIYNIFIFRNMA
jgi:cysteine synthase A